MAYQRLWTVSTAAVWACQTKQCNIYHNEDQILSRCQCMYQEVTTVTKTYALGCTILYIIEETNCCQRISRYLDQADMVVPVLTCVSEHDVVSDFVHMMRAYAGIAAIARPHADEAKRHALFPTALKLPFLCGEVRLRGERRVHGCGPLLSRERMRHIKRHWSQKATECVRLSQHACGAPEWDVMAMSVLLTAVSHWQ